MEKRVQVTKASEIDAALAFVKQCAASVEKEKEAGGNVCPLICEELLLRLLNLGFPVIHVSVKGRMYKRVEISAEGERAELFHLQPETEEDRIGAQISDSILEQYADDFTCQYRHGVNLYTVPLRKRKDFDLTGEICAFYQQADPEKTRKPADVLRQRVAIARALLRNPKIILLDEATSALDAVSERQVQAAIDAMMGRCTVVMVAHRLSTLRRADAVYRLDHGKLHRYNSFDEVIRDMDGGENA